MRVLRQIQGLILFTSCVLACVSYAEGGAGQILNGAAAIISAGAPIAVAGINAAKEAEKAAIDQKTKLGVTMIDEFLKRELAANDAYKAMINGQAAVEIVAIKEKFSTDRLLSTLRFLADRQDKDLQMQHLRLVAEVELQRKLLAAQDRKFQAELSLQKATAFAQQVSAGFTPGFVRVDDPLLTINPVTPIQVEPAKQPAAPIPGGPTAGPSYSLVAASNMAKVTQRMTPAESLRMASLGNNINRYFGVSLSSGSTRGQRRISSDLVTFQRSVAQTKSKQDLGGHRHSGGVEAPTGGSGHQESHF